MKVCHGLFLVIVILALNHNTYAFDDKVTHPSITEKAASLSLDNIMDSQLGYMRGIKTNLQGLSNGQLVQRSAMKWIREGSTDEDDPLCRASNHFHNPTLPWDQSGASDMPPQNWICNLQSWQTYSAITWATGYNSTSPVPPYGTKVIFSQDSEKAPNNWDNARNNYNEALTRSTAPERDDYLARTLGALGQVIHLLEDMAVPAHTRNDFWAHMFQQLALAWPRGRRNLFVSAAIYSG